MQSNENDEMQQLLGNNAMKQSATEQKTIKAMSTKMFFFSMFLGVMLMRVIAVIKKMNRGSDKWMKVSLARVLIGNKTTKLNNENTYSDTVIHVVLLV